MKYSVKEYIKGKERSVCVLGVDGRFPALDFLETNRKRYEKDVAEIERYMLQMANEGIVRNTSKFRSLTNGLFEFKSNAHGLRVTCFWHENRLLICGYCFIKKTQATPKRHLTNALNLKKDFEKRHQDRI